MLRPCCVKGCKNKFEYNANQKYCKSCSEMKYKERYTTLNEQRDRRVKKKCILCDNMIPKWSKKYCSKKCINKARNMKIAEKKIIRRKRTILATITRLTKEMDKLESNN